eukprot:gene6208-biopygen2986
MYAISASLLGGGLMDAASAVMKGMAKALRLSIPCRNRRIISEASRTLLNGYDGAVVTRCAVARSATCSADRTTRAARRHNRRSETTAS